MSRRFKPGNANRPTGKISNEREAWVRISFHEFVLYRDPINEDAPDQGEGIQLKISVQGKGRVSLRMTGWTAEELEAVRKIFNKAVDEALPICTRRDQIAQEAWEAGDDSHARLYRPTPQYVERQRSKSEHDEGVQG